MADDDRPISETRPSRRVNRSGLIIMMAALIVVVAVIVLSFVSQTAKQNNAPSAGPPPTTVPKDANAAVPERIADKVREEQSAQAEAAKQAGESYLPPAVKVADGPELSLTLEQPPPAVVNDGPADRGRPVYQAAPPVVGRVSEEDRRRQAAAMASYLSQYAAVEPIPIESVRVASKETLNALEEDHGSLPVGPMSAENQFGAAAPSLPPVLSQLAPGDILYAVNDFLLNSDSPTRVRATVIGGPLAHSVLLGGFEKRGDFLVLAFNRITLPNKKTYSLEAVALDPEESRLSVRSDVDRHTFERWALFLAGTWLGAAGEIYAQSGTTQTTTTVPGGTSTTIAYPEFDSERVNRIAVGALGQATADQLQGSLNIPSTVTLQANTQIGVMILTAPDIQEVATSGATADAAPGGEDNG